MRKKIWRRRTPTALAATFVAAVFPVVAGADSFVYTANLDSDTVSAFRVDAATGALSAVAGSPFAAGNGPIGISLHPSGKFAYAANSVSDDISGYAVDAVTGELTPSIGSPYGAGDGAQWITFAPSGTFAYVCNANANTVSAYRVNPVTGALSAVAGSPYASSFPFGAVVDPSGRFLYVANFNFTSGTISGFSINATTGGLVALPGPPASVGPQTRIVAVDPSGRFLYAASENANSVFGFSIDGTTGALTPIGGSPFPVGSTLPFGLIVDPTGRFVYVAGRSPGNVSGFAINPATGALTAISGSPFAAGPGLRTVAADVTGRYVYVSNANGNVSAYVVNESSGALTAVAGSPFPTGGAFSLGITAGRDFTRGDFNGDGLTDILWRHEGSGENVAWFMDGVVLAGGGFLDPAALADTNWKMVGTHDFNGDRQTDILWRHELSGQNVVWYMNGTSLVSGTFLTPAALSDTDWKMAGTGNFDGDGKPDIVWHHRLSGQIVIWYMNGSVLTSGTFTTPSALSDTNWKLVGVSDFNEDNRPDLLWHHALSGQIVLWFMNGSVLTAGTFTTPSSFPDTNWKIAAVGDYSNDRKPDILWRNETFGQMLVWYMDGATQIGVAAVTPSDIGDPAWRVVGPR
jgi:6-phosphogluconolactonase (cycloisomerase 2 family)